MSPLNEVYVVHDDSQHKDRRRVCRELEIGKASSGPRRG
jgi:hypothetical protein